MAKPNPVPRTDEQAEAQLARIGVLQREIDAAAAKCTDAVALLKSQLVADAKPLADELTKLSTGLRIWAENNRDRLTGNGKKKTVQLATGKINWKDGADKIEIEGEEAAVVEAIQQRIVKLTQKIAKATVPAETQPLLQEREVLRTFLREKLELNRNAMKDRPEIARTIPGVLIVPGTEAFKVAPLAVQTSEVV